MESSKDNIKRPMSGISLSVKCVPSVDDFKKTIKAWMCCCAIVGRVYYVSSRCEVMSNGFMYMLYTVYTHCILITFTVSHHFISPLLHGSKPPVLIFIVISASIS